MEETLKLMKEHGMKVPSENVYIKINDAEQILKNALKYFIGLQGRDAEWIPEYKQVSEWLNDNKGRGLFLYGNCGRGKTILAQYVLPAILLKYTGKVVSCYDAQEMNSKIDEVLTKKIICLDDIGTEELLNSFGNKRLTFLEVIDATEKYGKLLIITTNLNQEQLLEKYGDRAMDRVKSTTKRVLFVGNSFRK